jgi:hypothetical protein
MTENDAIVADEAADRIAVKALCTNPPRTDQNPCAGHNPPTDGNGAVMMRHNNFFRQKAERPEDARTAPRKYVCRFCRAEYIFGGKIDPQSIPVTMDDEGE